MFNRVQQSLVSARWCLCVEFSLRVVQFSRVQFESGALAQSSVLVRWCDPERKQLHPDVTPVVKLKAPLIAFPVSISLLSAACHLIMKLSISIKNSSVRSSL